MRYFKKIVGEQCYLSPVNLEDYDKFTQWLNDPDIAKYLNIFPTNLTYEDEKELLPKLLKKDVILSIIKNDNNGCIGNVGLHKIDNINRNAELGIMIGDKNYWNRGFGTEAIKLMLDYAFNVLNLEQVYLYCSDFNDRGKTCYKKAGFKEAGRLRSHIQINRKRYDMLIFDIISEDFESPFINDLIENKAAEAAYGQKLSIV